jgi:Tfp pilus assembly pilus retraction ATPase PilT
MKPGLFCASVAFPFAGCRETSSAGLLGGLTVFEGDVPVPDREIDRLLAAACRSGGSAVYLKPGASPAVRVQGRISQMRLPELTSAGIETLAREIMGAEEERILAKFSATVFLHEIPQVARFRVSVFRRAAGFLLTARCLRDD